MSGATSPAGPESPGALLASRYHEDPALSAEDIACSAGYRLLFEAVGFELHTGEWLQLTGPNGSGKTTLLRAIAGLVRPARGTILWHGIPRMAGSPAWHASMLFQGHHAGWKECLSTLENLSLQVQLDQGLGEGSAVPSATSHEDALERCGLQGRGALSYARLSAGQRRRLSLARLACSTHALWLLDEPTTALDSAGQSLFGRLLTEHLKRGGCAVVATHLPIATDSVPRVLDLGEHAGTAPKGLG